MLLFVAVGCWASFTWWSVLQERLITKSYRGSVSRHFRFPFFLNFVSYTACVLLSGFLFLVGRSFDMGSPWRHVPPVKVLTSGVTLSLGTPFGYAAMTRLAYPD